jgi:hypothetical protein
MPAMQGQQLLSDVKRYRHDASVIARAHYLAWERYSRWNRLLGIPVVILTALVGTAIFGTLHENPAPHWRILAGGVSVLATVLAALQTYLNFAEQAEKHREAGGNYAELRRRFNLLAVEMSQKGGDFNDQAIATLKEIVAVLNEVSKKSPAITDAIYDVAHRQAEEAALPSDLDFRKKEESSLLK